MTITKKNEKGKVPKSTITKRARPKSRYRVLEEYEDLYNLKRVPVSEQLIDRIRTQIIEWAYNDENALLLDRFFFAKGIPISTMDGWRKKFPKLDEACQLAKQMIGIRREEEALKRKFDAGLVAKTAAFYRPEWKKLEVWRNKNKLKLQENGSQQIIQWVLEQFPNSKLVPEKPNEPSDKKSS